MFPQPKGVAPLMTTKTGGLVRRFTQFHSELTGKVEHKSENIFFLETSGKTISKRNKIAA